jgi:hypothetical protein
MMCMYVGTVLIWYNIPFYVDIFVMWFFDAPTIYSILQYFLAYFFKNLEEG